MSKIELKHIDKYYGKNHILKDVNLTIEDGDFMTLLGPSGCGKTTTLRVVSGLEKPQNGTILMNGKEIVNAAEAHFAPPSERELNLVFQSYALWPHMTVRENIAFGLNLQKLPKDEVNRRIEDALARMQIGQYVDRYPSELSGGQQQRVAIARAIASEPHLLLMDEPLSNLDAKLRASMRTEISKLHARLATTFIYVTHDQIEAMTMGTRIVVMKDGFVQQVDTPQNLYDYPVNLFVAGFIGTPQMNFFKSARLVSENNKVYVSFIGGNKILLPKSVVARIKNLNEYLNTDKDVTLGVRPEDIHQDQMFLSASPDTIVKARIEVIEKLGAETQIYCELDHEAKEGSIIDNSTQMIAKISSRAVVSLKDVIDLAFDANHIHLFDGYTEATMLERDAGYEVIPENAEGSAFVPPTPQEMRAQIDAARIVTKEMKAQMKKDARMAKRTEKIEEKKEQEVKKENDDNNENNN